MIQKLEIYRLLWFSLSILLSLPTIIPRGLSLEAGGMEWGTERGMGKAGTRKAGTLKAGTRIAGIFKSRK